MAIQIPKSDHKRLAKLLSLSAEDLSKLYEGIRTISPRLDARELTKEVRARVPLDSAIVSSVVRLLLTLNWVKADQETTPQELASQICLNARKSDDPSLQKAAAGWEGFQEWLTRFLSLDRPLGVTAKALFVAYQYPRHFHEARVLTDARPVFAGLPSEAPSAFVINHTLQIEIHENGKDQEWFVTLSTQDLVELKTVIDRALQKGKSLKALLDKTGADTLDWEDE